jgi:hypothetical protein
VLSGTTVVKTGTLEWTTATSLTLSGTTNGTLYTLQTPTLTTNGNVQYVPDKASQEVTVKKGEETAVTVSYTKYVPELISVTVGVSGLSDANQTEMTL